MKRIIRGPPIEIVFWFLVPGVFIGAYVFGYGKPTTAAPEHLYAIFLIAAIACLARILAFRIVMRPMLLLTVFSMAYALLLFALLCYYIVVIVVLGVWGKVITEEIIVSYFHQAVYIGEFAELSFPMAFAALAGAFLLIAAFCRWWLGSFGWLPEIPRKYDKLANILFFSLLLLASYRLYDFLITPSEVEEPFSLTLFSGKRRSTVGSFSQGRSIDRKLAALEARVMADYQPNPNAARTNLVIIVVDALRYDHMGVSGYERETTPYLSGLAKRGKVSIADQARSVCGESVCGLASLASGRYSHQIPAEPFTLHRVLKRHGYQIRMILGDNHRNTYDPVALYGVIDDYFDGSMAKGKYFSDDGNVLSRTRELPPWNKQPFMLQYHLMSAHTMGKRLPIYQRFLPAEKYAGKVSGEKNERNTNHYDNGVLQADAIIEQLLASLKGGNYLQDTLVVVTADHGESLGEHDFFSHTNSVREELLHIPLAFIRYKNGIEQDAVRNEKFVSQIDIAPTILHEFHMPIPSTWTGLPVQLEEERKFIFFQMVPNLGLYDIRDRDRIWKYWVNAKTLEEFAFDLRLDAGENTNLIASVPDWLRASWRTQIGAIKLNDTP